MLIHADMATAALDAALSKLGAGSTLLVYAGPKPATLADPTTGATLILSYNFNATAFAPAADQATFVQANANAIADALATADGTAAFFRAVDGTAVVRLQGTVTETGLGGELEISTADVLTGTKVSVTSLRSRMSKGTN